MQRLFYSVSGFSVCQLRQSSWFLSLKVTTAFIFFNWSFSPPCERLKQDVSASTCIVNFSRVKGSETSQHVSSQFIPAYTASCVFINSLETVASSQRNSVLLVAFVQKSARDRSVCIVWRGRARKHHTSRHSGLFYVGRKTVTRGATGCSWIPAWHLRPTHASYFNK